MVTRKIYLYQLVLVLFALTANCVQLFGKIQGKVCDKIGDGKFRAELIKCMKMMPMELQMVWKSCGAKYFHGKKVTCDYCEIINEMCVNPTYARNVGTCVERLKDSSHDSDTEDRSENQDKSDLKEDEKDELEEDGAHDMPAAISKECLRNLFHPYNITVKGSSKGIKEVKEV